MGNKIGRRSEAVDDRYTRPQGHYQLRGIDEKKLRKLILESKLAPCYPGLDECSVELDECLICFLFYPRLNRSRCCRKMICTECFLQIKPSRSKWPIKCPFCKTRDYAVEYRGVRTKEEMRMEEIEEQRVLEARIRIREQELRDDEDMIQKQKRIGSSNMIISSQWEGVLDMDLEDIMVLEAVGFPVQHHGAIDDDPGSGRDSPMPSSSNSMSSSSRVGECYGCRTDRVVTREDGVGNASSNLAISTRISPSLSEGITAASHLFPGSFEEQMMLAMAVSLAEN